MDEFAPYKYGKDQNCFSARPAVNIKENADNFELEIAAPGLIKEDFKVKVEKNILTISAEKDHNAAGYVKQEFGYHNFQRSFELGERINQEDISARYENGVLHLTLAKKEEAKQKPAKKIAIA
jgi:HSP20 family protein